MPVSVLTSNPLHGSVLRAMDSLRVNPVRELEDGMRSGRLERTDSTSRMGLPFRNHPYLGVIRWIPVIAPPDPDASCIQAGIELLCILIARTYLEIQEPARNTHERMLQ